MPGPVRDACDKITKSLLWAAFVPVFLFTFTGIAHPASVTLAWDQVDDPDTAGYNLYWGTSHGSYTTTLHAGNQTSYTVQNMPANQTVYFAVTSYVGSGVESAYSNEVACSTISASAGANGQISPSGDKVFPAGASQTYTITPNAGFTISDVVVDGTSVGPVSNYTFTGISSCHTISAVFAPVPPVTFTISASAPTGGAISPSGTITVTSGASQAFSISPATGYVIANVLVDGASVGAVSTYTFSSVAANHTISATFQLQQYTLTASAGTGGAISPSGAVTVNYGATQSYTITPFTGYAISGVTVDGASVGAVSTYKFTAINVNHVITASFGPMYAPISEAGPDQTVKKGQTVTLSGVNSRHQNGLISAYRWWQVSGAQVSFSNASTSTATFTAPDTGTSGDALIFGLEVTDSKGIKSVDYCIVNIMVQSRPPVANAGKGQNVAPYTIVSLDATGSLGPDSPLTAYSWAQVSGPSVQLSDPVSQMPTFVAPDCGAGGAALIFELTVTDAGRLKARDQVIVNVVSLNSPPVAKTSATLTAIAKNRMILDGSGSSDPDGGIASEVWSQVSGPPAVMSGTTSIRATFVAPNVSANTVLVFRLQIKDAQGLASMAECTVTVMSSSAGRLSGSPATRLSMTRR